MPRTVICLSASDGAAGERVAERVSTRLGYRLVDEQIIATAAEIAGVDREVMVDAEKRKTVAGRLAEELPAVGMSVGMSGLAGLALLVTPDQLPPRSGDLRGSIVSAIEEVADSGEVVIVAHASSLALRTRTDTLRVLVTASEETRRARFADAHGVDDREAQRLVSRGDANRAAYLKRFHGVAQEDPWLYDLVLNTDRLTPDDVAEIVVAASQQTTPPA